jgi:Protein of unknown function (DUF3047)
MNRSGSSVFAQAFILATVVLTGCAELPKTTDSASPITRAPDVVFAPPNDPAHAAWHEVLIRFKTPTVYTRAEVSGSPCILAEANGSWSLHVAKVPMQFANASKLSWRWYVPALVAGADNEVPGSDDAPARLVVAFKGDKSKLDAADRSTMTLAKALGGNDLPFAAIQYIWETDAPLEKVIPNFNISRIKKLVVRSGEQGLAQWQTIERDVREDFRRAFPGEEPGEIESIGLMTDTDSLGGVTRACYADVRLQ